jgi:hypothetical protein
MSCCSSETCGTCVERIPPSTPVGTWKKVIANVPATIFFFLLWVLHLVVLLYIQPIGQGTKTFAYGGEANYLTEWINVVLVAYWGICWVDSLLLVLAKNEDKSDSCLTRFAVKYGLGLHRFRDAFFAALAFPVSVFVGISFIVLIGVYGNTPVSIFLRVWQHIVIMVLNFIELVAFGHEFGYGGRVKGGLWIQSAITLLFALLYLATNLTLSYYNQTYPYGFQNNLTSLTSQIIGYTVLILFVYVFYWVGYWLNLIYVPGCCGRQREDAQLGSVRYLSS